MARRSDPSAKAKRPAPTRAALLAFVEAENWSEVTNATGGRVRHHDTSELALPDGRVLRTRISRPPDGTSYGPGIWSHILRDQIAVTEDEFWDCVVNKQLPARGQPAPPDQALPADLVYQLVVKFHIPETEVAAMTKQEAIGRLAQLWSQR
jgi:hypothetical protein